MHVWVKLLESDEKNISYFIKFFLKHGTRIFVKILFKELFENAVYIGSTRAVTPEPFSPEWNSNYYNF